MKLTKKEYKERLIDKKIDEYLKIFGAISIEGPKWCGKTWTALNHSNSASFLNNTVDNFREKHLAEMDVNLVLDGEFPRTIDEWQEVPAIWDAVRYKCDQDREKGKYILTVITLLFYLLSTNFIAYHLVKPLENFYQNKSIEQLKQDKNDVIIMLGGGAINVVDIDGEGQVSGYVANRMITVMRLQKELNIPIILSGGKVFEDTGREADIEKRIFEGMGVDSKYLILENQSRNTVENVQNSKVIMEDYNFSRPLVITSGFHLPRAMEIFAREGIEATPYVADYQMSDELVFSIFNFLPNNGSLNTSCMAIREYLGILALKLKMQ